MKYLAVKKMSKEAKLEQPTLTRVPSRREPLNRTPEANAKTIVNESMQNT